jgi:hypothetical protein
VGTARSSSATREIVWLVADAIGALWRCVMQVRTTTAVRRSGATSVTSELALVAVSPVFKTHAAGGCVGVIPVPVTSSGDAEGVLDVPTLVTAGVGGAIRAWSGYAPSDEHYAAAAAAAASAGGEGAALNSHAAKLATLLDTLPHVHQPEPHAAAADPTGTAPDSARSAAGSVAPLRKPVAVTPVPITMMTPVPHSLDATGRSFAVAFTDGVVRVYRRYAHPPPPLGSGSGFVRTCVVKPSSAAVRVLAFAPDGRYLAAGADDGSVFFFAAT